MDLAKLLRTIYLGDRACKAITIDGWNKTIRIQIDCISRVRSPSGTWDYYTDEDIADGFLVFGDVSQLQLQSPGCLPNDEIELKASDAGAGLVAVEASIGAVDEQGVPHEFVLRFQCRSAWLEDPRRPGMRIED